MQRELIKTAHLIPPVYKKVEDLTASDIVKLEEYAHSMRNLLKNGRSDTVVNRRADIRQALNAVIEFLFQFNINLTHLTYNND